MLSQSNNNAENEGASEAPSHQARNPSAPKSKAKANRDKERSQQFRMRRGAEANVARSAEFDKGLYFGFNFETRAMQGQNVCVTPQARILPVTTRAIGFSLQSTFAKMNQTMNNIPSSTVHEAYRVSLAQVQLKLTNAYRNQSLPTSVDNDAISQPKLTYDQEQIIRSCSVNFNVVSNIINAIGTFEYDQKLNYVRVPKETLPAPHTITFDNLERNVKLMSNLSTPRDKRLFFYKNNPLPGALWTGIKETTGKRDHDFEPDPILANPEDFWPNNYNDDALQDDVYRFMGLLSWASRKGMKYVDMNSQLDFSNTGQKTSLVSNYLNNNLHNAPMSKDEKGNLNWNEIGLPLGQLNEFWTPDVVDNNVVYIGALQLLGEVPPNKTPIYRVRCEENAVRHLSHGWVPIFNNMMG